jgi:hypothetical protein
MERLGVGEIGERNVEYLPKVGGRPWEVERKNIRRKKEANGKE